MSTKFLSQNGHILYRNLIKDALKNSKTILSDESRRTFGNHK